MQNLPVPSPPFGFRVRAKSLVWIVVTLFQTRNRFNSAANASIPSLTPINLALKFSSTFECVSKPTSEEEKCETRKFLVDYGINTFYPTLTASFNIESVRVNTASFSSCDQSRNSF